ncbi:MAG: PH domain-containing protein [Kosmotogaceae bacterium]|nr:PH domain-containing protein [Kosmotogaceae bacterium]
MAVVERGIELRRSYVSYIYNYILIILVLFFLYLAWIRFELTFVIQPTTLEEGMKTLVVSIFLVAISALMEEPTIIRHFNKYMITNSDIIDMQGILTKKRVTIPYQSVTNVKVIQSVTGRILGYGTIEVVSFKDEIKIVGVRDPEVLYRIINNKIAVTRGNKPTSSAKNEEERGVRVKSTNWREEAKSLEDKPIADMFAEEARKTKGLVERLKNISLIPILGESRAEVDGVDDDESGDEGDDDIEDTPVMRHTRTKKRATKPRESDAEDAQGVGKAKRKRKTK